MTLFLHVSSQNLFVGWWVGFGLRFTTYLITSSPLNISLFLSLSLVPSSLLCPSGGAVHIHDTSPHLFLSNHFIHSSLPNKQARTIEYFDETVSSLHCRWCITSKTLNNRSWVTRSRAQKGKKEKVQPCHPTKAIPRTRN